MTLDKTDYAFQALTPEIRAILGVFALYGKLDDSIEKLNDDPKLAKMERRMIIRLDQPRRMGQLAQMTNEPGYWNLPRVVGKYARRWSKWLV